MAGRKKSYFSSSNKGKAGSVFVHNMFVGKTKAEKKELERDERIQHLMTKHGLPLAYLAHAKQKMKLEGIAINKVEASVIIPWAKEYQQEQGDKARAEQAKIDDKKKQEEEKAREKQTRTNDRRKRLEGKFIEKLSQIDEIISNNVKASNGKILKSTQKQLLGMSREPREHFLIRVMAYIFSFCLFISATAIYFAPGELTDEVKNNVSSVMTIIVFGLIYYSSRKQNISADDGWTDKVEKERNKLSEKTLSVLNSVSELSEG